MKRKEGIVAIQRFEEIQAWQEARALASMVYDALERPPFKKDLSLGDQLRRAAISVMANIAEGFGSQSNKEFIRFLYIALRSCSELQSHLYLGLDRESVDKEQFDKLFHQSDLVRHRILGFIKYLKKFKGQATNLTEDHNNEDNRRLSSEEPAALNSEPGTRNSERLFNQEPGTRNLEPRRSGFTLIELLVVIIIIGLLAALVGPKLFGRVGKGKQAAAQAQIELFGAALDNFRLDVGRYPTSDEGLRALLVNPGAIENWDGSYLKKEEIPLDPWGHPYVYKSPGEHGDYDILSYGGDGVAGGEGENQDLVSWKGIKRGSERIE
jgi:general secretion pathway protein G